MVFLISFISFGSTKASAERTAIPFCLSAILKASKRTAIFSASFMVFGPTFPQTKPNFRFRYVANKVIQC